MLTTVIISRLIRKLVGLLLNQTWLVCQAYILLQSESPSGMCAKLCTVAASNNKDHAQRSLFAYANHNVQSFTSSYQQRLRHDHSIIPCSRHIYMVLFFSHILFMVNHAFSEIPAERLQQRHEPEILPCSRPTVTLHSSA